MLANFRKIAVAEGISYLAFAVTMPLKYVWDIVLPNKIVGYIHAVLFMVYVVYTIAAWSKYKWSFEKAFIVGIASIFPGATFWVEKKYLQDNQQ